MYLDGRQGGRMRERDKEKFSIHWLTLQSAEPD